MKSEVRGSLERRLARSLATDDELISMRRAAWRAQGIAVIRPSDIRDDAPSGRERGDAAVRPA